MITSNEPWSAKGNQLLSAQGDLVATFTEENDLFLVLEYIKERDNLRKKIEELIDKAQDLEDVIPYE